MKNKKGFILSTYVYILLVFFLLLLGTMLAVLNNTRLLSNKLKEQSSNTSGLVNKDFSFVLLGDKETIIRKGEEFIDPGYIIKSSGGNDLSDIVKVTGSVNSDTLGIYELTYTATYNGVTTTLTRIVRVVDNIAANYLTALYTYKSIDNGLIKDDTADKNIRYSGNHVKNYVEFGNTNELWRIIGTFNVTTASGNTEKLVKIVRDELIGWYSWDSSESSVNNGYGVNEWSQADLMTELNTLYLNRGSGTCFNGENNATTTCAFSTTGIDSAYRNMLENVVWNTGGIEWNGSRISVLTTYNAERETITGKICTSGAYCTDTVTRTTIWEGKVGLIYPSDYGYASTNEDCRNWINASDEDKRYCKNDNWLHTNTTYWALSPLVHSNHSIYSWHVNSVGCVDGAHAYYGFGVRPSVYLKSNISITSGDGSSINPYKLSINS